MTSLGFSLSQARLAFSGQWLFDGLTVDFAPGSWTGLLGRSGSGKSSLLRMIAGLPIPDTHDVTLTTSDERPLSGRLAWMAQQDQLLPWRKVIDNVLLGPALRDRPSAAQYQRALDLLGDVGLSDKTQQWPKTLSGGERQRVALARTLFEDAPVILMDEPFSAVDAITRLELHELAARLLAGRTVLLVTHDPLEALRLSDRILILSGQPASLSDVDVPDGHPPRALDAPDVQRMQSHLVRRLHTPHGPIDGSGA
ncbi:putative hydroxymethylpyrimidine transport system ATP-binding protein [Chromohalobacter marismortui]|uniref:Putative hydroxymethylpyrimidine transport system ATP-binding protein n=1 Tax=Chromohalobacter marismortui TaxID=42055 RepID=A0A4R7NQG9_9GAMM|nr:MULTISPECIES: ABC transporter ATP-binding protein [Chromohalobacter]MCI0508885.1 ABC transporter ATP-binding protein [Chromohalobacter sp.]MCI0594258.1 ABC transporter ATP-binding protein [Chromohalobacter sp.]TDU22741.1 putative hydroxymethylpyrimidine transport system ATP-binding protein [Chromohalobacter marismortui]